MRSRFPRREKFVIRTCVLLNLVSAELHCLYGEGGPDVHIALKEAPVRLRDSVQHVGGAYGFIFFLVYRF